METTAQATLVSVKTLLAIAGADRRGRALRRHEAVEEVEARFVHLALHFNLVAEHDRRVFCRRIDRPLDQSLSRSFRVRAGVRIPGSREVRPITRHGIGELAVGVLPRARWIQIAEGVGNLRGVISAILRGSRSWRIARKEIHVSMGVARFALLARPGAHLPAESLIAPGAIVRFGGLLVALGGVNTAELRHPPRVTPLAF